MNQIKIEGKLEMINLSAHVEIGPLKVKLIAQVIVCKGEIDMIEFMDIENEIYNGIEISDWRKFVNMNKEFGIDFDSILNEKFDNIFEESVVKEILGLGN
jgi:23S rRNA G2445 N2-methylase RlmL